MQNPRGKHFKEDDFNKLKLLQQAGLKEADIKKFTGRGHSVVHRAKASANYTEYKQRLINERPKPKAPTTAVDIAEHPRQFETDYSAEMVTVLTNIDEHLQALDGRLDWLEDHMVIPPRKLNFFGTKR